MSPRATTCIDCNKITVTSPCPSCKEERGTDYYRTSAWRSLRRAAAEQWGSLCMVCDSPERIHWHHKVPRREGGADSVENLRPLCGGCHSQYEAEKAAGSRTAHTALVEAL